MLIKLAALNLLRNKRRNVLLVIFIGVSVTSLCLFLGYIEYSRRGIKLGAVAQTGHAAIAKKSYWNAGIGTGSEHEMKAENLERLIHALADMAVTTEKVLDFSGLLGSESDSTIFSGSAYENESSTRNLSIEEGQGIFSEDLGYIMTGKSLAKMLKISPGDSLQLSAYSPYGLVLYTQEVAGTVAFPSINADKFVVVTNIANAWDMLGNYGNASKLQVRINNEFKEDEILAKMKDIVERDYPDLALKTWEELSPIFTSVMNMYNSIFSFLLANFLIFIFVAILQTVINISLERTREFGTLRALGITRLKLALLVLQEMLIISLLGMVLAFGLTVLSVQLTRIMGLGFTPPASTQVVPTDFYFDVSTIVFMVILPVISIVVLSCLYPIIRIARLEVTKVLEG